VGTANTAALRRVALAVGIPGLPLLAVAGLVAVTLLLISVGDGAALGARDMASQSAANAAGIPDADLAVYQRAGNDADVPWQLLASLVRAEQVDPPDAQYQGPFRIVSGTSGITAAGATDLSASAGFIARRLASALQRHRVNTSLDLLATRAVLDRQAGFDIPGTASNPGDPTADRRNRVIAALTELPVRNANQSFMSGVYDTALRWALGQGQQTCSKGSAGAPSAPAVGSDMPYPLLATHGFTGAEEPIDDQGRVPSGKGVGVVTWSKHAALGRPYRDYYITMRWTYAAWNWDGTSTGIDQAQFAWFAEKPRLVLVTNPRTGASIIAAALEAGPAPWVGVTSSAAGGSGADHGWPGPIRGTPDGYTGIVSGFPPTALAALGDASGPARTGYPGQAGDNLTYQWAPDQTAPPGPVTGIAAGSATTGKAKDGCRTAGESSIDTVVVQSAGVSVTLPIGPTVDPAAAGQPITAPTEAAARGLAAGLGTVGLPYVWGGGTDGGGPDNGCARGGGAKNSCGSTIGLDCSGLTGWTLANAGFRIPTDSASQRAGGTGIPRQSGRPGDIIGYPGHVAVYLG
jgi:cell wall-associated NlpC family hydrolase